MINAYGDALSDEPYNVHNHVFYHDRGFQRDHGHD